MTEVSTNTILDYLKEAIKNKTPLDPDTWLDAAGKLNILLSDELDMLADMRQKVAQIKLGFLEESDTTNVSAAKLKTDATDEYRDMEKQKAKCSIIEEMIRIAKVQARKEGGF